jgi:DNA replication and repair protein RecF
MVPDAGMNLIHGRNGSGKTSLLEAIYILSRGKSFRSNRAGPLIQKGKTSLHIFGSYAQNGSANKIGIEKTTSTTAVKANGQIVSTLSELARLSPLHIITPSSHQILEQGPEFRRKFLEWGVFHVEHSYQHLYRRYLRVLQQRNAALRNDPRSVSVWNGEFIKCALEVDEKRRQYLKLLVPHFNREIEHLLIDKHVSLELRSGWDTDKKLEQVLINNLKSDIDRGFTQSGPHRADLVIKLQGVKALQFASRGQQKLLISALKIAQITLAADKTNNAQLILYDDIGAELDSRNLDLLINRLEATKAQLFLTTVDPSIHLQEKAAKLFHVEHGELQD